MSNSVFIGLAQALEQLLKADPPLAGDRVWRDRLRPVPKEHASAIVIKLDKTDAQRGGTRGSPTDWSTSFAIECYARCAADQLPSEAVDGLLQGVFERVSTVGPALGLDVEDLLPDPRIEWDLGEADTPLACAVFHVRVIHRTQAAQLQPWS